MLYTQNTKFIFESSVKEKLTTERSTTENVAFNTMLNSDKNKGIWKNFEKTNGVEVKEATVDFNTNNISVFSKEMYNNAKNIVNEINSQGDPNVIAKVVKVNYTFNGRKGTKYEPVVYNKQTGNMMLADIYLQAMKKRKTSGGSGKGGNEANKTIITFSIHKPDEIKVNEHITLIPNNEKNPNNTKFSITGPIGISGNKMPISEKTKKPTKSKSSTNYTTYISPKNVDVNRIVEGFGFGQGKEKNQRLK